MTLTIVYDNNRHGSGAPSTLRTSWGFACWIETRATTVLFDTGADGPTLLANLKALHLDPRAIDTVVLSHAHGDHTGGLGALLDTGVRPTVYAPESFPRAFKEDVRSRTELVEVGGSKTITQGIRTTGEVGKTIIEQALVVATEEGAVVITGCAHPGIVEMVRRARGQEEGGVALVVGGFHLGGAGEARIQQIARDLRALDVKRVAPCHCTGDEARRIFSEAFGDDCALAGVGWSTSLELELDR